MGFLLGWCTNAPAPPANEAQPLGMYTTTRHVAGGTFMICKECEHVVGMNKTCETPLQSATNILKHMATRAVLCATAMGPE